MKVIALSVLMVVLVVGVAPAFAAATKPAPVTVPKYTVIPVVLDDTISTKKNKTGDKFEVHCTAACSGFPSGTTFVGVLTITPAKESVPGQGSAKFTHAILPDERKIEIVAQPSTAEGVKKEGQTGAVSKGQARRKGALLGAGIGALAGDTEGALIGAAVGATAGGATKGQGKDVEVKAGSKGYIVLLKPVTIPPPPTPKKASSGKK